jgi:hypothetical protein|tara:strand:+ start:287 stop:538 length:252 start_codon:yes stop_codon:yes gene_type:complete
MYKTKHAESRINQRGINAKFIDYAEFFLPSIYERKCTKIFLSRKVARAEAKKIRQFAEALEKHAGTELLIDSTGSSLITAYRK